MTCRLKSLGIAIRFPVHYNMSMVASKCSGIAAYYGKRQNTSNPIIVLAAEELSGESRQVFYVV